MASDYSLVGGDYGLVSGDYSAVGGSGYCPGSLGSGSAEVAGYWNSPFSIKSAAGPGGRVPGGLHQSGGLFFYSGSWSSTRVPATSGNIHPST